MTQRVILATGNESKVKEIRAIFDDFALELLPQTAFGLESPEETGRTFVENALQKAVFAATQLGVSAIADDSGIAVDALNGRPGVWSARYAGQGATDDQNVDRLLYELRHVPDEKRTACFHCAAVFVHSGDDKRAVIAEAIWRGKILRERRGIGGFGYDPVFYDVGSMKTGAEMSREEKNIVSHRGKAFKRLRDLMEDATVWI
ncbi:MAG: non-canonical purine NTP pyrophosphatase, RdgB/HAM1 family [Woeseia sp.]|nr:non-canonical purine NTP pyrophosphatase, RdgB/HAM1 family [Woeseia sp.]